jgi:hypothetical protein
LFNGSWQNTISAIIDVLSNDVDSSWSPAVKFRGNPILLLEPISKVNESWLMLVLNGTVEIRVDLFQFGENWHVLIIFFH